MRLLIASNLYPPDIGGPATYVARLAQSLQEAGVGVKVVAVGSDPAVTAPYPLTLVPRALPTFRRMLAVHRLLLKEGADVDFLYSNCIDLPTLFAARKLGKPLALKIVGDQAWEKARVAGWISDDIDDFQTRSHGPKLALLKRLRAWGPKRAKLVITPSHYLKKIVAGWGVAPERIQVVHNATETIADPTGQIAPEHAAFFRPENQVLISVGRLVDWKGNDQALEALRTLPPSVRLLILGDGPDENRLRTLVHQYALQERVCFAGKVAHRHLAAYFKAAFALVLPTGYEGLPHTVIEAQAAGCPVITTDKCGNPEAVTEGKTGLLVPYGNVQALTAAIQRLLEDGALRQTLISGGLKSCDYFNWDRLTKETLAAFEKMLREK